MSVFSHTRLQNGHRKTSCFHVKNFQIIPAFFRICIVHHPFEDPLYADFKLFLKRYNFFLLQSQVEREERQRRSSVKGFTPQVTALADAAPI